jgi:hypothetical protein
LICGSLQSVPFSKLEKHNTMSRTFKYSLSFFAVILFISTCAFAQVTTQTGSLPDGATYLIQVPANWNGTLLLYSHGYVVPGTPNPAHNVGDPFTGAALLGGGFALAGSSYATTGWAIHEALPDQIAVLDLFNHTVGHPKRTIAWGHSLGGIITAGLIQRFPDRFDAALPMCGVLSGGVATWNQGLRIQDPAGFRHRTATGPHHPASDQSRHRRATAGAGPIHTSGTSAHCLIRGARRHAGMV